MNLPKALAFHRAVSAFGLFALPENCLMQTSDGLSKSQAKLKPVFSNENWFYSVASAMLTLFFHLILQMYVHPCDDEGYSEEG